MRLSGSYESAYLATTQTHQYHSQARCLGLIISIWPGAVSNWQPILRPEWRDTLHHLAAVVILSFCRVFLWGSGISENSRKPIQQQGSDSGNVIVLFAWLAVLLGSKRSFSLLLILITWLYCGLESGSRWERKWRQKARIATLTLRTRLTSSVVLMHGIVMLTWCVEARNQHTRLCKSDDELHHQSELIIAKIVTFFFDRDKTHRCIKRKPMYYWDLRSAIFWILEAVSLSPAASINALLHASEFLINS